MTVEGERSPDRGELKCSQCGENFATEGDLLRHIETQHDVFDKQSSVVASSSPD
jgi:hypothetical protein